MAADVGWEIPQTIDTIDPLSPRYNPKSAYAKALRRDGKTWGGIVPTTANAPANLTALSGQVSNEPNYSKERRVQLPHHNTAVDFQILHTFWADSSVCWPFPVKNKHAAPPN